VIASLDTLVIAGYVFKPMWWMSAPSGASRPHRRGASRSDRGYAVERTRRRGQLRFQVSLEPTVIAGEADRINRAVSNLLDNARKWSPADATVEIDLHEGVLSVRDRPGL
jgi:signal transduction histidine kinase